MLIVIWLLITSVIYTKQFDDIESSCSSGGCDGENEINHEKNKYKNPDGKWSKYIRLIKDSVSMYKPCKTEDCFLLQRRADFRLWIDRGGIHESDFQNGIKLGEHYKIINHTLFRKKECIFPSRCKGNEHFILQLINQLPDMEMIINTYDWPKVYKYSALAPVFSFSKQINGSYDILYPAWSFWEGGPAIGPYPTGIGRWDIFTQTLTKEAELWPWEKKLKQGFFRGSRTSNERDPLILLSREQPLLIDAQYTKNQAWKSNEDTLNAPPAAEVTMEEHCRYKYLFNFRGIAASFRFKHLFLCESLVFHVGDEWIEFFYPAMKPWVHYVPVSKSLVEVRDLLQFFNENDHLAKEIANRGQSFVRTNLRMSDVSLYWYNLLKRYAKLSKWKVLKDPSFIEVKL
ncbi:protein O-glucosyltransferase 1 isoform X1 [Hydra vulgaris]|uniref:protein O-glucosyltransferase 1 isoform X1 n=1 Tax=Hydra vulgaris TaxID=6087 RepID=UPI001F5FEA15|nr:protein O-glucosyltransferase 1 [Hydra vulgaris]